MTQFARGLCCALLSQRMRSKEQPDSREQGRFPSHPKREIAAERYAIPSLTMEVHPANPMPELLLAIIMMRVRCHLIFLFPVRTQSCFSAWTRSRRSNPFAVGRAARPRPKSMWKVKAAAGHASSAPTIRYFISHRLGRLLYSKRVKR